jgi:hypothetical protein
MLMNTNMAAYTAGILALTVSGDNTDPGMIYWKNGTDGHLKLKTDTSPVGSIIGTTGTYKGRILANSDGVWRGVKGLTVTGNVDNTLTANTHGLANGTLVSFFPSSVTDVLPAPLQVGKSFFVVSTAENTFKVSLTSGGSEIDLTTAGTGTFGVDTCLAIANKAVIELGAASQIMATYLDIELVCTNPTNLRVRTYKTKYDFTANGTNVSTADNWIDLGTTPPAADLAVMITTVAGTLPAPLAENTVYYVRAVSGNTCKLASYSGSDTLIIDLTSTGSGTCSIITGHTDTAVLTINVLEDVRADPGWSTTAGHNRVALVSNLPANYDQQRGTLKTINETSIEFNSTTGFTAIDSTQGPGAWIAISSRNVSIRSACTTAINIVSYSVATTAAGVFQCEIANSVATGTTFNGTGLYYGTGHIVSGSVFGCSFGLNYGTGHIVSGSVFGCSNGFNYGTGHIVSGSVFGCSFGLSSGTGHIVSGSVFGCSNGLYSGTGHIVSGSVFGCYYGLSSGTGYIVSGSVFGCSNGLYYGTGHIVSGSVFGCYSGLYYGTGHIVSGSVFGCSFGLNYGTGYIVSGSVFGCSNGLYYGTGHIVSGSVFGCSYGLNYGTGHIVSGKIGYNPAGAVVANASDFRFGTTSSDAMVIFLRNATIPAVPTFTNRNTGGIGSQGKQGVYCEDHGNVLGASFCYQPMGNVLKTAINAGAPAPTTNPAGTTTGHCIEASSIQTNCSISAPVTIFENHKLWMAAGTYTITYKVQTDYSAIAAGLLKLTCRYCSDDSPLTYTEATHSPAITTRSNANDWTQTLYVTVVVAADSWVECKMLLYYYESAKAVFVWPVPVIT